MSPEPDDHGVRATQAPGSLPRSAFDLAVRLAGFGVRTTVGLASAVTHRTAAVVDAALSQTITAVVDRVDVQQVVDDVDLNAVLDRVDLQRLLGRLDLDAVLDRVDIDALLDRVDLDAVVARLDTVGLARHVIDGVDLPEIIRESTGTMATESVGGLRLQTLHADDAVAHLVDRIIRRNGRKAATATDASP